ncbi:swr complex subunit [Podila epicladia]|nr:swr complex subunit [Podila epicladia]KAG0087713.1 swr complex subunit [Podila epicladia]
MAKPPKQENREESESESSDDEDYVPNDVEDIKTDDDNDSDDSDKGQNDNEADSANDYATTRSGKRRANTSSKDSFKKPKQDEQPVDHARDLIKKSKLDALWAEMNAPVVKQSLSKRTEYVTTSHGTNGSSSSSTGVSSKMVTITTSYEFAGETVTVTKDVPEDSKEAKEFAQKNLANGSIPPGTSSDQSAPQPTSIEATSSTLSTDTIYSTPEPGSTDPVKNEEKPSQGPKIVTRPSILDSLSKKGPVRYVRKKSTLDELAATYGVKKPAKLNTLEKSKLDWNQFVGKEGIEDELKHHNKDGYMEKVAFLQRTDARRDQEYQAMKKKK